MCGSPQVVGANLGHSVGTLGVDGILLGFGLTPLTCVRGITQQYLVQVDTQRFRLVQQTKDIPFAKKYNRFANPVYGSRLAVAATSRRLDLPAKPFFPPGLL